MGKTVRNKQPVIVKIYHAPADEASRRRIERVLALLLTPKGSEKYGKTAITPEKGR